MRCACVVLCFPDRFGGKRTDIRKALATVKKAGVKRGDRPIRITPHIFRKAMATWLRSWNDSDRMLQARLGHAPGSRVTNRTYVHVSTEEQRAIVFELFPALGEGLEAGWSRLKPARTWHHLAPETTKASAGYR
ncbi:tyrosine-type recombinase/integrase [Rhizobium leguminosarum]|uniref:tyrosine-type recombinase/integrase n=1 Tax=Rhizobium leguminosarum TaxID=384 RepID=UPI003F9D7F80